MSTLLLVNPAAGRGRAIRAAADAVLAARATWSNVLVRETHGPGDGVTFAREAALQGAERVVVVGGDGTAHEAANGLLQVDPHTRPALAVVAAGTGNDFAKLGRTCGHKAGEAIRRLARGVVRRIDVGRAWGEVFLNSVGIGIDAAVAEEVNRSGIGAGIMAYLLAVGKVIRTYRASHLEVTADGVSFSERSLLLEVGNGPVVGGGFRITPHAIFDDGLFDVCAVREHGIAGILAKLPLVMLGKHTRLDGVRSFRTTQVSIRNHSGPIKAQLDGELRSHSDTMDVTLEPGALPVLIAGA